MKNFYASILAGLLLLSGIAQADTYTGGFMGPAAIGALLASPGPIGSVTPNTGAFTILNGTADIKAFGAKCNGTTDDTAAINSALAASLYVTVPAGCHSLISSTVTIPVNTTLQFNSFTNEYSTSAYFIKKSTMTTTGIILSAGSLLTGGGLICQSGNTGDGVAIRGHEAKIQNFYVQAAGGVGVRVGDAAGDDVNMFELDHVSVYQSGSHGIMIHDGQTSLGGANANAGTIIQPFVSTNGGDGIHLGFAYWVTVINGESASNTGWGLYISGTTNQGTPESRNATIIGGDYYEGVGAGAVYDDGYFSNFFGLDANSIPTTTPSGLAGAGWRNLIGSAFAQLQGLTLKNYPLNVTAGIQNNGVTFFDSSTGIQNVNMGSVTPGSGAFTTLSASGAVSGTGFTNYMTAGLASGQPGAFTTLSASGAVSGTGFSNYLASPPAIGGTAPAAGKFTTLNATTSTSLNGVMTASATTPAWQSGFGTTPSIVSSNGTGTFTVNVGTGAAANSGVITMSPAAPTGWNCSVGFTPTFGYQYSYQSASTTTSITLNNMLLSTLVATPWTASQLLKINCTAY